MNVLAVDVGGTHLKVRSQKQAEAVHIVTGPKFTPDMMMAAIHEHTSGWKYDRVTIGFPAPVVHDHPLHEPFNLGKGWVKFRYAEAFKPVPVRMINDAAMQALGSYRGGRMLFLGLGTGLGSAMVVDGVVQAMELAHLPWKKGKTYEEYLGEAALTRSGRKRWEKNVHAAIETLSEALESEYTVLGGGNARHVKHLPEHVQLGSNDNAFLGAFLLWKPQHASSR